MTKAGKKTQKEIRVASRNGNARNKMKTYRVNVREVWIQPIEIEAKTKKRAIEKVEEGEGICLDSMLEYSYTLETDTWDVSPPLNDTTTIDIDIDDGLYEEIKKEAEKEGKTPENKIAEYLTEFIKNKT